jgi:preprotein translocase subunit SecG
MDNSNNSITVTKVTTNPNTTYTNNTTTETSNSVNGVDSEMTSIYDYMNNILMNPSVFIILVIVVILYLGLFMMLGSKKSNESTGNLNTNDNNNNSSSNIGTKILTIIFIAFFIVLIIINGLQYFFGVDIVASIKNLFSGQPEVDISVTNPPPSMPTVVPEIKIKKQVFNIPGNDYVYPDAKALCNAYGADLANYQQIEKAYNQGAEWCNYGWSDGQMALFPTQQKTFDGLQDIPGHENDCGRPGINGGFMANPALKFGVNCYGYKPIMTDQEEELMQEVPVYPKTVKDIAMEQRVDYWKEKIPDILISPFNHDNWSKI